MAQSFTPWQDTSYPAGDAPFNVASVGGPQPAWHDYLDFRRSGWRATPEATYPDGYLGTINSRRQDRLLQSLTKRATSKPYTRGVHKGERRDPSDYFWPAEFNLMSGLEAEARGEKFTTPGIGFELGEHLVNGGKPSLTTQPTIRGLPSRNGTIEWNADDPDRQAHLRRLAPPWSSGPGIGVATAYPGR